MGERFNIGYKRLFEVRLLHHYWLDDGATIFDLIPDAGKKDKRLLNYDIRSILSCNPTKKTELQLRGLGCVFKETPLGFIVAVPELNVVPAETELAFTVLIEDNNFFNYTALTLQPRKIFEFQVSAEKKTYRYKENALILSNQTGTKRVIDGNQILFLSAETPAAAADDGVESLVRSGNALLQLTSDNPGAATQQIGANASTLPVFQHQSDAPLIVPPAAITDAPKRGIELNDDIPDDIFALIKIRAVNGIDDDFSCVGVLGTAKPTPPIFQIRFKNRSTTWTYRSKNTGDLKSTSAAPLALTYFGNAGTNQKPSSNPVKAEKQAARITKLYSEIFV
jgi:hypothetical protein